jgi:hypothetical protein
MKSGMSLAELGTQLLADSRDRLDLIAGTGSMRFGVHAIASTSGWEHEPEWAAKGQPGDEGAKNIVLLRVGKEELGDVRELYPTSIFHRQVGTYLGLPTRFYNRLLHSGDQELNELLVQNANTLLRKAKDRHGKVGDKRMVRTLRGNARAFLSKRYRRLDNYDVANAVLPILTETPGMRVESANVTDTRMYIKAIFPKVQAEVTVGDVVQAGIIISNSELGFGLTSVKPLIYRLACLNGMVLPDSRARRRHIGKNTGGNGEDVFELYSEETVKQDDKAFLMKIQDTVRAVAQDSAMFQRLTRRLQEAAGRKIEKNPVQAVEVLSSQVQMTETEQGNILTHLIEGGDLTQWGLANSVTRASQDSESYDRATELERVGGHIINLSAKDWNAIASLN